MTYEEIKSKLFFSPMYKDEKADVVYEPIEGIRYSLRLLKEITDEYVASAKVTQEILEKLHITENLTDIAIQNTIELYEPDIIDMGIMRALTNTKRFKGSSVLLNKEYLAEVLQEDMYILPPSIHEVITVPATEDTDVDYLLNMVKTINSDAKTHKPTEILADAVYKYNHENGEVTKVA